MIFEYMLTTLRQIISLEAKIKAQAQELNTQGPETHKSRRVALYSRLQVNKEELANLKHELHRQAVIAGIADYNPARYGTKIEEGPFGLIDVYRPDPFSGNTTDPPTETVKTKPEEFSDEMAGRIINAAAGADTREGYTFSDEREIKRLELKHRPPEGQPVEVCGWDEYVTDLVKIADAHAWRKRRGYRNESDYWSQRVSDALKGYKEWADKDPWEGKDPIEVIRSGIQQITDAVGIGGQVVAVPRKVTTSSPFVSDQADLEAIKHNADNFTAEDKTPGHE